MLKALAHLSIDQATDRRVATQARETTLNYLTKRLDQIQYATFQARGSPIDSGGVESANKLVVEVRLKAVQALGTLTCEPAGRLAHDRLFGSVAGGMAAD